MASILTNAGAVSALQTLRQIATQMGNTQGQVSSGLRVQTAADNAAYWSIATTMRSDNGALSAVQDALGLGAATVDTAYAGLEAVVDILAEFKAKLVASMEDGVDKSKIQEELDQLKQQVVNVAQSASFSGENWLDTKVEDIFDPIQTTTHLTSSFTRDAAGAVSLDRIEVPLSEVSLFNSTGGGLLQKDPRDSQTLGGMRYLMPADTFESEYSTEYDGVEGSGRMYPERNSGTHGEFMLGPFPVDDPLDFNVAGAEIRFEVLLDKEVANPYGTPPGPYDLPGPYFEGALHPITITKADIDAYDAGWGGIISDKFQFAAILNQKLMPLGAEIDTYYGRYDSGVWVDDPEEMSIETREMNGYGSYVEILNLSNTNVGTGGLINGFDYGSRGSGMGLRFKEFTVHKDGENEEGVEISFQFSVNNQPPTSHSFNRTYVNALLGRSDGRIETAEDMAKLMQSLLEDDWPGLIIEATSDETVMILSDPALDRKTGSRTDISFENIRVSIEPLSQLNLLDLDIEKNPDAVTDYIDYIEATEANVIDATALVGALSKRISLQEDFADKLMSNIDRGVGRLVDADMNEVSSRLKALETQEQLAIQALSIANSNSENIISLFR
jgi:flagellin